MKLTDDELDALLPEDVRARSGMFWTPVAVARRAGRILEDLGVRRVLDVGSGPGKFCVTAAAQAPNVTFAGVEHRPHLVAVAQSLAAHLRLANVIFHVADATSVRWTDHDAFYVFNSFAENRFCLTDQFDSTVPLSPHRRVEDVIRVVRWLSTVRTGAVLVTYHGLGGPIPKAYECVHTEAAGSAWLRVWRKRKAKESDMFWFEEGEEVHALSAHEVATLLVQEAHDD